MVERFDAVVVGARCAGSPLAAMLAGHGLSVCVLDKSEPTTDTPSTHVIQPNGVEVLRRLGLAEETAALTDPITRGRLAFDDVRVDTGDMLPIVREPMLSVRRHKLDPVLARRAVAAGADLRTGTPVTDLLRADDGRVTGVVTPEGEIRAGLVVGADGTRSTVARLVGAREYLRTEIDRAFLWGYFEDSRAPESTISIGKIDDNAFLSTPTDDGLSMAVVAICKAHWREAVRDLDAAYAGALRGWPELADAFAGARRVGGHHIVAQGYGYFRQSAGPGWVLVGDAGHFKDPTPGQGIADALRQAERLTPAILAALGGRGEASLAEWWRWRDADALGMYWFARQMGASGPLGPLLQSMLSRLTSTDRGVERFIRVLNHDLSPDTVFGPSLLVQGLASGLRARPGERRRMLRDAASMVGQAAREQWAGVRLGRRRSTVDSAT